jgi:hypothetical protein
MDDYNEGVTLPATTLLALGQRGIVLDMDLYGAANEDDGEDA